ncbi:caspase family protein [Acetobacter sp. P1H12_c]|uniref:caspase family protein n=1 Tax=Acetobacter sp. P1H12_c TaxID=2762621 RepID=UPI001C05C336|nr:caspase family protein [Acetobacter sp. P1H12_c]
MGQNIAVLVGNTRYDELSSLSCCKNDVEELNKLLTETKKFHHIAKFIDEKVNTVKDSLRDLAKLDEDCDEIFFYFTGHGLSNTNDFYMCFEHFKENSPNTTGISHTEILSLLRNFHAKTSVIVIDACEAGRNLIKSDTSPLSGSTKVGFKSFIQFSSCTESQYSLAGDELSLFTSEFIKSCLQKELGVVYYSDVESALRDAFLNHISQTPHFIRQGIAHEKFCNDATSLSDFRNEFLRISDSKAQEEIILPVSQFTLAKEKIEKQVPTMDAAQAFINGVFETTLETAKNMSELEDFFQIKTSHHNSFDFVENKKTIIDLLERRGNSDFLTHGYIERKKKENQNDIFGVSVISALGIGAGYTEIYHLYNNCELKSVHSIFYFNPKSIAMNQIACEIVFLPRLTECLILTSNSQRRRSSWNSFSAPDETQRWKWSHYSWHANPIEIGIHYANEQYKYIENYIMSFNEEK